MKAIIESLVVMPNETTATAFVRIVNAVLCSKNEEALRKILKIYTEKNHIDRYFKWGFGSSHFWVHQLIEPNSDQVLDGRVLLVRF